MKAGLHLKFKWTQNPTDLAYNQLLQICQPSRCSQTIARRPWNDLSPSSFSTSALTRLSRDWRTRGCSWENESFDPGGRVNAQPQFIHNTFQPYWTVISTGSSLLGTATQPISVPGAGEGEEDVGLCDLRLCTLTPAHIPELHCSIALVCVCCVLFSFSFVSFGLVIFIHLKSRQACVCVCVLRTEIERQQVQILPSQNGCFSNAEYTAGQLFPVKETNTENASQISDYLYHSSANKRKRKKSLMNANLTLFSWWPTFTNGADYLLKPVCLWEIRKDLKFWQVPEASLQPEPQRMQMINECLLTAVDAGEKAETIHKYLRLSLLQHCWRGWAWLVIATHHCV